MATEIEKYLPYLATIDNAKDRLIPLLEKWVNINTFSENIKGLSHMLEELTKAYKPLGGDMERLPLPLGHTWDVKGKAHQIPLGDVLSIRKRPGAAIKVFLGGHMDTVFSPQSSFQKGELLNPKTYQGPGSADMKGGILIMLMALEALEASPFAQNIGWEVLINSDEEIGSLGSRFLICEAAQRNHIGLVFEPALPDGYMVSQRKGSTVFSIVSSGISAHAGRDYHLGKNAINALARFIVHTENYAKEHPEVFINVGQIDGGTAVNIVPNQAVCRINVRVNAAEQLKEVYAFLTKLLHEENETEGIKMTLHEQTDRPPKLFDEKTQNLFKAFQDTAGLLGHQLAARPSGGVCDGNLLAAAGLATLDTLGPIGGNLHTENEFVLIDSILDRAKLTALFLMRLNNGET